MKLSNTRVKFIQESDLDDLRDSVHSFCGDAGEREFVDIQYQINPASGAYSVMIVYTGGQ